MNERDLTDNFQVKRGENGMKLSGKLQKVLSVMLALVLVIGMVPATNVMAEETTTTAPVASPTEGINEGDIVILYDNDAHCSVEGYAKVAYLYGDYKYTNELKSQRTDVIDSALGQFEMDRNSLVESGTVTEIQNMQAARDEYVKSLGIQ